jgi:ABC-type glycerol-3-phosphate transport system permease component
VPLHVPGGARQRLQRLAALFPVATAPVLDRTFDLAFDVREYSPGARFTVGDMRVSLHELRHSSPNCGVRIESPPAAVLAAYALVRFRTRAGQILLLGGTAAILVPAQALLVPQFLMLSHLGWLNSYAGLIVPQLSGSGVALLLLLQHVRQIPPSLIEAAILDGANSWRALWNVVLPLLRPALAAVGTLVFINTWNEYLWPLIATPGGSPGTIQTGLALFLNTEGANPGPLLAAATLSALPAGIGYLFAARRVTGAFMHSGIG